MANHYHKSGSLKAADPEAGRLLTEIEEFLRRCARPAVVEIGDEPVPLLPGQHLWEIRNGGLFFSAWPAERSINRRITAIEARKPGLLVCTIRRFGGVDGRLNILDIGHPRSAVRLASGGRHSFSETFRRMLSRQFPGWAISSLSTEMSLPQSLSPKFPRAVLEQGKRRMAALACPALADESQFLSFALLWHHHVSGTEQNRPRVPLVLFLPADAGNTTALRLKWLRLPVRLFRYNQHGSAGEIDASDIGNMDTRIISRVPKPVAASLESLIERLHREYGVECVEDSEAGLSLRCNGLDFAQIRGDAICCGLTPGARRRPSSISDVESLAAAVASVRHPETANRAHPLYRSQPENWLESGVRKNPGAIDASLEGQPVWSQVITFAAADRDVIDLLSASRDGRVVIIELKTTEDIHLPLQALDYWMRAEWHIRTGDLDRFFPATSIQRIPPRLLLVAPAVSFHPTNEVILSYFDSQIEAERVGLNLEWQQGLKVAFRLSGSEKPQSQRRWQ